VSLEGEREREAGEVDEAVCRRHEERQVVQPVGVDAPDERAGDLAERREGNDAECLRAPLHRHARQRGREHDPRDGAEEELLRVAREVIEREQERQVGGPR
jgi:hypothetical protein